MREFLKGVWEEYLYLMRLGFLTDFMFKKRAVHNYHVVEVDKGTKLPELTGDLKEGLKALPSIPAFNYLLMRLRYEKAGLENYFKSSIDLTDSQLRYIQLGLYWLGHVEATLQSLTRTVEQPRPATNDEAEQFARMRESLTLIS